MIKVKHPLAHFNKAQEELIEKTNDLEKEFQELMFSYGNATYIYHNNAKEFRPSIEDYNEWLSGLSPMIRKDMEKNGFEACKTVLSFARYVNEKNDLGMEAFVEDLMGRKDFEKYKSYISEL